MNPSAQSLVLAYIENYAARDVAPFVESLRATDFEGDVVFFTYNVADDCAPFFAKHDVQQIPVARINMRRRLRIPNWLARGLGMSSNQLIPDRAINIRLSRLFRRLNLGRTRLAWTAAKLLWHCQAARFLYVQEFLEANPQYESVLIADARDVVFQRDPFAFDMDDRWYIFEEYPGKPLGRQRENAGWVRSLYGPAVLEELSDFPVLCVGLMLGRRRPLLRSLRTINEEIVTNHIGWSTDQGVPNYFIRAGRLPDAKVVPYGSGPAMHVGIAPRDTIHTDTQGRVLNHEGEVCNIVHQYDRHPDLADALLGRAKAQPAAPSMVGG